MQSRYHRRLRFEDVWPGLHPSSSAAPWKQRQAGQSIVEVEGSDGQPVYEEAQYWTEVQLELAVLGTLPLQHAPSRTNDCIPGFQVTDNKKDRY